MSKKKAIILREVEVKNNYYYGYNNYIETWGLGTYSGFFSLEQKPNLNFMAK